MTKNYWVEEVLYGNGFFVTDGIWESVIYETKEEAIERMSTVSWGVSG